MLKILISSIFFIFFLYFSNLLSSKTLKLTFKIFLLYIILFLLIIQIVPKDFLIDVTYNAIGFYNFSGLSKKMEFVVIFLPVILIYILLGLIKLNESKK